MTIHPPLGYGEYLLPPTETFEEQLRQKKIQTVGFAALFFLIQCEGFLLSSASYPLISYVGTVVFLGASAALTFAILYFMGLSKQAPSTHETFGLEKEKEVAFLNEPSFNSGFATKDSIETHALKLDAIRNANSTICYAGCYFGGLAAQEVLDAIALRLQEKPHLSALLIVGDLFLDQKVIDQMEAMKNTYPDRFWCITHPETTPYVAPVTGSFFLFHMTHMKLLITDGTKAIFGGSDETIGWSRHTGTEGPQYKKEWLHTGDYWIGPQAFRDRDAVIYDPTGKGLPMRAHMELYKLAQHLSQNFERSLPFPEFSCPSESILSHPRMLHDLKVTAYTSGPDQQINVFAQALLKEISHATQSIEISHMYFLPPRKILRALEKSAQRGVKITVFTNQSASDSPGTHLLYCTRSCYYAKQLYRASPDNVELFTYNVPYTTLHTKIWIFDSQKVFMGSSNIGPKSLEGNDHEWNAKIESPSFAKQCQEDLLIDRQNSLRMDPEEAGKISLWEECISRLQKLAEGIL